MWRHVCGPRGGGATLATPHVPLPPMSAHTIVPQRYGQPPRLTENGNRAYAPGTPPHDPGATLAIAILRVLASLMFYYRLQYYSWILCGALALVLYREI